MHTNQIQIRRFHTTTVHRDRQWQPIGKQTLRNLFFWEIFGLLSYFWKIFRFLEDFLIFGGFSDFWKIFRILDNPKTCDIWDTDYNSDNWEPEFMTIFVIWQLIVTLDSIRNFCDVFWNPSLKERLPCSSIYLFVQFQQTWAELISTIIIFLLKVSPQIVSRRSFARASKHFHSRPNSQSERNQHWLLEI